MTPPPGDGSPDDGSPAAGESGGSPPEVFMAALRLGLTSFGGPVAHLGYFRREYVERRRWLDDTRFADLVALSQLLPGPASSQLGIAIGTARAGMTGGFAAWLGFTLPSAMVMTGFGLLAASTDLSGAGWVHGLKLAAVAVVAQAVWAMSRTLAPDWSRRALALVAAAVALAWASPLAQVAIMAGGAVAGRLLLRPVDAGSGRHDPSRVPVRVGVLSLVLFVGLLVGLPVLRTVDGTQVAFVETFYRSGSLVFGGGHVVLPLLHAGVVVPGWVTEDQFLAGYGAAQAVPGPLVTFAGYLGAVSSVPPNGLGGAVIALLAIFLPSFLMIYGTLPLWDRLRRSTGVRRALTGTNAAVVGILLAALVTPIWTSAIGAPVDVAIAGAGLGLLLTGRVPPIAVVLLSALAGQAVGP